VLAGDIHRNWELQEQSWRPSWWSSARNCPYRSSGSTIGQPGSDPVPQRPAHGLLHLQGSRRRGSFAQNGRSHKRLILLARSTSVDAGYRALGWDTPFPNGLARDFGPDATSRHERSADCRDGRLTTWHRIGCTRAYAIGAVWVFANQLTGVSLLVGRPGTVGHFGDRS